MHMIDLLSVASNKPIVAVPKASNNEREPLPRSAIAPGPPGPDHKRPTLQARPVHMTAATLVVAAALVAGMSDAQAQSSAPTSWQFNAKLSSAASRCVVSFPTQHAPDQLIVSFADRRLYHVVERGRAISYPIAVPRPEHRWDGVEKISYKKVNPSWRPTAQMRREDPDLPDVVPGGAPQNPLGVRAIYLGNTLYRIHGTDAPWTIGSNVSRGCVRMHNEHVAELYDKVRPGMKVTATWKRYRSQSLQGASARSDALFSTPGCN